MQVFHLGGAWREKELFVLLFSQTLVGKAQ